MSIFEKVAGLELRSCSGFCGRFGKPLQNHRFKSAVCFGDHATSLGRRRSPAGLFCRAAMVFVRPRFDFFDRVRLALGADRRTYWVQRNYTGRRISSRRPRPTWRPGLVDPADPLLVQLERCLSPFSLWRRSCVVAASDFWHRARTVVGRARCFLSFARNRWPNISQLSVGYSPPRDRLLVDLFRALAALAETRN